MIEPEANPKWRLLMKSASLTASGSGQQKEKRSIPDDESRMQVEDMSEMHSVACSTVSEHPEENCCEVRTSSSHQARCS